VKEYFLQKLSVPELHVLLNEFSDRLMAFHPAIKNNFAVKLEMT